MKTLISPPGAGVGSTFGLLAAPLAFDFVRSAYSQLDKQDWGLANQLLGEMAQEGRQVLENSGLKGATISYRRSADIRYVGQGHEVSVPLPDGSLGEDSLPQLIDSFREAYRRLYSREGPHVPLEVINWRVSATGPSPKLDFRLPSPGDKRRAAVKGSRLAYFPEYEDFVETSVYDRYALVPGDSFSGPAIVEEREATLVVGPTGRAQVDEGLNVIVEIRHARHDD